MSRRSIYLLLAIGLAPVVLMGAYALSDLGAFGRSFPNGHALAAFMIGAVLTVLLSVGLFSLAFFSARRGYDERVIEPASEDDD